MPRFSPVAAVATFTSFVAVSAVQKRLNRCPTCHQQLLTAKARKRAKRVAS